MRALILMIFLFMTSLLQNIKAQELSAEEEVQTTIDQLFKGMHRSDSSLVAGVFTRDAIMQTVANSQDRGLHVATSRLQDFLQNIHNAQPGMLNEKLSSYHIKIDGELASAWTPYQFYVGEEFSHCGVNSFQLLNTEAGWKIFHVVDTRRTQNCEQM